MKAVGTRTLEKGRRSIKILSDRTGRSKSFQETGTSRFAVSLEIDRGSPDTLLALANFSPSERSIIIRQIFEQLDEAIVSVMATKAIIKRDVLDKTARARQRKAQRQIKALAHRPARRNKDKAKTDALRVETNGADRIE